MRWKLEADRPIYIQLMEQIQLLIIIGIYPPGSKLPSVRDIAAEAAVNPNTMQRAFSQLEIEELIHSDRTKGRFVTEDTQKIFRMKNALAVHDTQDYIQRMKKLGYDRNQIDFLIDTVIKEDKYIE
ncbi:MAG: GntR family transcriptional regulator [Eubacteriales bacterium]